VNNEETGLDHYEWGSFAREVWKWQKDGHASQSGVAGALTLSAAGVCDIFTQA